MTGLVLLVRRDVEAADLLTGAADGADPELGRLSTTVARMASRISITLDDFPAGGHDGESGGKGFLTLRSQRRPASLKPVLEELVEPGDLT